MPTRVASNPQPAWTGEMEEDLNLAHFRFLERILKKPNVDATNDQAKAYHLFSPHTVGRNSKILGYTESVKQTELFVSAMLSS